MANTAPTHVDASLTRIEASLLRINRRLNRLEAKQRHTNTTLNSMNTKLNRTNTKLSHTNIKLNRTDTRVTTLSIRDASIRNSVMSVDDTGPFVEVLYGDNPLGKQVAVGQAMVQLPRLVDMQAINGLTGPQATVYHNW